MRIPYAVEGSLAIDPALQDSGFVKDGQVLGDGGLRPAEGGQDLADAALAAGEELQQLQAGWIGKGGEDLDPKLRNGFVGHGRMAVGCIQI